MPQYEAHLQPVLTGIFISPAAARVWTQISTATVGGVDKHGLTFGTLQRARVCWINWLHKNLNVFLRTRYCFDLDGWPTEMTLKIWHAGVGESPIITKKAPRSGVPGRRREDNG